MTEGTSPPKPEAIPGHSLLYGANLEKSFKKRRVVQGLTCYVQKGEIAGFLGPNGAGKTTTFRMLAGLEKPQSGEIFLNKTRITHMPLYIRARFGMRYLPQESSIFPGLTVEENLLAILELFHPEKPRQKKYLQQLLEEFDLTRIRSLSSHTLSGGERRRVEIARCLIGNPTIVLMDEPFAGIDPKMIADIRSLVLKLKEKGLSILITDHNVRDTLGLVDRAYVVANGTILKEGLPAEIAEDPHVRATYLGRRFKLEPHP